MPEIVPKFSAKAKLARFVHEEFRQSNKRPKPPAFMLRRNIDEKTLSVNSLEVATAKQIAAIYRSLYPNQPKKVAVAIRTIAQLNKASEGVGLSIAYDPIQKAWKYIGSAGLHPAYEHSPKNPHQNRSHCDVHFLHKMTDAQEFEFAVQVAYKPTYKVI